MSQETKQCQNCKNQFTIEPEDFKFYEKISVPPPTFCPECRLQRRLAWRNVRSIYKRVCDLCKEEVMSVYSPDKPFKVYCSKCWWSDRWEALEYGRDYDFSRPFFEQFYDLMKEVPLLNRFVYENTMVRSDYTNMGRDLKDCYLVFHGDYCEYCYYSDQIDYSNDCIDTSYIFKGELCYDSVNLQRCYRVFFSKDSESCQDCYFIKDCIGCSDCFGSVNLRNKQYHILNKPHTKESYLGKLKEIGFFSKSYISVEQFRKRTREFWNSFPVKFMHGRHNSNVSGDYIIYSKNTYHSFHCKDVENSKFCAHLVVPRVSDSYDWTQYGENGELVYEMLQGGGGIYNSKFGWCIWQSNKNVEYGILNIGSSDCFGCISIKKKQYCILNKQYSENEYKELRGKIIKQMEEMPYIDKKGRVYKYGEFFPIAFSPFGYNETFAQEEFPIDYSIALEQGYNWADIDKFRGKYDITTKADDLPDNIDDVADDILKDIIKCQQCKNPYRIFKQELEFYRTLSLPLPRLCVQCRYLRRIKDKNPSRLWIRKCACAGTHSYQPSAISRQPKAESRKQGYQNTVQHFHQNNPCPNEFETTYPPERKEIVYCEQCYLTEVV